MKENSMKKEKKNIQMRMAFIWKYILVEGHR